MKLYLCELSTGCCTLHHLLGLVRRVRGMDPADQMLRQLLDVPHNPHRHFVCFRCFLPSGRRLKVPGVLVDVWVEPVVLAGQGVAGLAVSERQVDNGRHIIACCSIYVCSQQLPRLYNRSRAALYVCIVYKFINRKTALGHSRLLSLFLANF